MLIFLRGPKPLKRILSDGTKEWYDGGEKVCLVFREEYDSRVITRIMRKQYDLYKSTVEKTFTSYRRYRR